MPAFDPNLHPQEDNRPNNDDLHFPPVSRDHILHCSYDYWFPKYRTSCIRSKIIPLTPEFISYIREDGIILADDDNKSPNQDGDQEEDDWEPTVSSVPSFRPPEAQSPDDSDSESDTEDTPPKLPPNQRFPALHASINAAITSLGGAAAPKLNWSSPKDATWISRHPNTVKCTSANDVYILLKSSSFISHDLDHAFADTFPPSSSPPPGFKPVLVLRSFFNPLPSLEFRAFVKSRNLVGITQRDLRYYPFLSDLREEITSRTAELFSQLQFTFPDADFVFDVYIPEASYSDNDTTQKKLGRARLIDINPWAPRTDSLLFHWSELLSMEVARPFIGPGLVSDEHEQRRPQGLETEGEGETSEEDDEDDEEEDQKPELRLVERDDPAAFNLGSAPYSAHKLPKDVVDASMAGEGGMREFARQWQRMTEGGRVQDVSSEQEPEPADTDTAS
ncbi:D123-domain-containing protein [Echria macrotheca]|uniref:D123-domain-containing protein n=1 Tax=Echria macrotheca TaxID=438768 RepID=A0AAJ0BFE7_9PEZI|nr:D123-domain-containing protein [Echria macrotheca]